MSCTTPKGNGICEDISVCKGDYTHYPGHCPGPAAIQCCVANEIPASFVYVNPFIAQERLGIAVGALSVLFSFAVLFTGYMFKAEMVKNKLYMKILLNIAFCNFVGSLSMIFGYPLQKDVCAVQGFFYVFFFRASWLWCLMLTIVLYQQLNYEKLKLTYISMNCIIWGANVVLQVLPFLDNDTYGLPTSFLGRGFCSLGAPLNPSKPLSKNNRKWLSGLFFLPLVISCVTMLALDAYLYYVLLPRFQSEKINKLVANVAVYPVVMFLLWMPTYLVLLSIEIDSSVNHSPHIQVINLQLTNFAGAIGIILGGVFFLKSHEARQRWIIKFKQWGFLGGNPSLAKHDTAIMRSIGSMSEYAENDLPRQSSLSDKDTPRGSSISWRDSSFNSNSMRFGSVAAVDTTVCDIAADFEADAVYEQPEVRVLRSSEVSAALRKSSISDRL